MSEAVIYRFEPIQIQNRNRESTTFCLSFHNHLIKRRNESPPVREIGQSVSISNLFGLGLLCYCERLCAAGPFSFCSARDKTRCKKSSKQAFSILNTSAKISAKFSPMQTNM